MQFIWAGVNVAIALGCTPKTDQASVPGPPWWGEAFKGTLEWFVCGENVIRPRSDPFLDWTSYKSSVLPAGFSSCLFSSRSWDFGFWPIEEQLRKFCWDTINDVNVLSDGPDRAVWYENGLKWLKNENCIYNFLPLVCTKQSEQQMWKQPYWVHLSLQAVSCQYGCLELVLLDSMIRWNNHIGIFGGINLWFVVVLRQNVARWQTWHERAAHQVVMWLYTAHFSQPHVHTKQLIMRFYNHALPLQCD